MSCVRTTSQYTYRRICARSHKMLALAACSALAPRLEVLLLLQLCRLHGRSEEALCCDTQCSQHSASSKQWACHWTDNVLARLAKQVTAPG